MCAKKQKLPAIRYSNVLRSTLLSTLYRPNAEAHRAIQSDFGYKALYQLCISIFGYKATLVCISFVYLSLDRHCIRDTVRLGNLEKYAIGDKSE